MQGDWNWFVSGPAARWNCASRVTCQMFQLVDWIELVQSGDKQTNECEIRGCCAVSTVGRLVTARIGWHTQDRCFFVPKPNISVRSLEKGSGGKYVVVVQRSDKSQKKKCRKVSEGLNWLQNRRSGRITLETEAEGRKVWKGRLKGTKSKQTSIDAWTVGLPTYLRYPGSNSSKDRKVHSGRWPRRQKALGQ